MTYGHHKWLWVVGQEPPEEPAPPSAWTAYVVEYGAIGLPLGHPSRVTCMEVHNTFAEAAAVAEACEFDARVFPITIPDPANEPGFMPVLGARSD